MLEELGLNYEIKSFSFEDVKAKPFTIVEFSISETVINHPIQCFLCLESSGHGIASWTCLPNLHIISSTGSVCALSNVSEGATQRAWAVSGQDADGLNRLQMRP